MQLEISSLDRLITVTHWIFSYYCNDYFSVYLSHFACIFPSYFVKVINAIQCVQGF